jgi:hypothetical protein
MTSVDPHAKTIAELLDRIEQIREELLAFQNSLEQMERGSTAPTDDNDKR